MFTIKFQTGLMATYHQNGSSVPFRVPRPTTTTCPHPDIEEVSQPSSQSVPGNAKKGQVRWTDEMDEQLVNTLIEQVLAGTKRADNGFTATQILKVAERVYSVCGVAVVEKNVRGRLKTLKKDYTDLRELFKVSGFGWDAKTGRITADPNVWEEYIKVVPNFFY